MLKPLRVLFVEDQETDVALLLRELRRVEYEVTWERVETPEAMLTALTGGQWDLILSDFQMPRFSAPEALAVCHEHEIEVPFIIVSGTIDEAQAVESMRSGAHDFIVKGKLARLGPAIARGLREFEERRALRSAEARLLHAQKMEAIGLLAGGVAHDFNNLLGVVRGYGELLLRCLDDDEATTRVQHILHAAERGADLTRQLLAFGRKQSMEPNVLDLNALVRDIEPMLRRVIGEDIAISADLTTPLDAVFADRTLLEQLLLNLVINACDAMAGGGRLMLETRGVELGEAYTSAYPDVSPGHYVLLSVSDTGHGMSEETLSHIFEPFFTTKEPGRGTGLGLATAYGIVRQSGGHISTYSELGMGTTFKIYLPRSESPDLALPVTRVVEPARGGSETVLLIEDEESLRSVIHELLREGGYTVVDASKPEDSLVAAAAHPGPIHLVLTDVVMPGISGREAVASIQATRPQVRVLYMSGYSLAAAGHHGPLLAGQAFIQKPFSFRELLLKVRSVLDSSE